MSSDIVSWSGSPAVSIWFFDWSRTDEFEVVFAVEAVDDGLRARIETVIVSAWDGAGYLTEFLDGDEQRPDGHEQESRRRNALSDQDWRR
ncbi:hypothetical protein [Sphaerisporangium album]|uniref:hypothetical protein n=1 Tax=Sphaerisporangium album TaxID=509200 RepID=UPI0015EFFE79|nr:hypothetical protein [Sphaerisporangium album]